MVDYAQLMKQIDYKQEDEVLAVQQIVDLIAVYPPMVVVTSLIDSFHKVSNFRCKPNKSLPNSCLVFQA